MHSLKGDEALRDSVEGLDRDPVLFSGWLMIM